MKENLRRRRLVVVVMISACAAGIGVAVWLSSRPYVDPTIPPPGGIASIPLSTHAPGFEPMDNATMPPDPSTEGVKPGDSLEQPPVGPLVDEELRAVELDDGTFLVVDPAQPLPAEARKTVAGNAAAAVNGDLNLSESHVKQTERLEEFAYFTHATTGRWPVIVMKADSLRGEKGATGWVAWARVHGQGFTSAFGTQEDVIAQVDEWLSELEVPGHTEVITLD